MIACQWMKNKNGYDPRLASRSLRYFVDNKLTISDVLICRQEIDDLIANYRLE